MRELYSNALSPLESIMSHRKQGLNLKILKNSQNSQSIENSLADSGSLGIFAEDLPLFEPQTEKSKSIDLLNSNSFIL